MEAEERDSGAGVRRVDAVGRRWYTAQFKREVVAQCLRPGASVSRVSIERGLNTNLVRKWVSRERHESALSLLPVRVEEPSLASKQSALAEPIEIRLGSAVIAIGPNAPAAQLEAIVRALR
ncbi:MAG: transposase [Burkholderiaceae bacterium]